MSKYLDGKVAQMEAYKDKDLILCPECKYYYAPVCTFYPQLPMTSRHGFCYHAIRGKYEGPTPTIGGFTK